MPKLIMTAGIGGNDASTVSMLHLDGADASTTFTDEASAGTHTWAACGTAQIDTAQQKFGTGSALFDGNSDYIQTPYSADFNFGGNPFTWDFWVRFNSLPTLGTIVMAFLGYSDDANANRLQMYIYNGSGTYYLYMVCKTNTATAAQYNVAWTPSLNTWYHLAMVRNGTNLYMFINGTSQTLTVNTACGTNNFDPSVQLPFTIGRQDLGATYYLDGWIDEVRISKGIARWTASFTPPTEPYSLGPTGPLPNKMIITAPAGGTNAMTFS